MAEIFLLCAKAFSLLRDHTPLRFVPSYALGPPAFAPPAGPSAVVRTGISGVRYLAYPPHSGFRTAARSNLTSVGRSIGRYFFAPFDHQAAREDQREDLIRATYHNYQPLVKIRSADVVAVTVLALVAVRSDPRDLPQLPPYVQALVHSTPCSPRNSETNFAAQLPRTCWRSTPQRRTYHFRNHIQP